MGTDPEEDYEDFLKHHYLERKHVKEQFTERSWDHYKEVTQKVIDRLKRCFGG